ncbi:MAG TPA: hypothetical protein VHD33_00540, partial [Legionellaceae bacterium]|nr:hypothetical protein [Legionellaceae bacterium]
NQSIEVTIKPNHKLPYSLIKPYGQDDFELSFGGSRGVVAPFEGLEAAYGRNSRKQGFKNLKLVGEGQQGTVKQLRNFLTHAGSVLKKVYLTKGAKQTFKESARAKLETLPISARDDSQFEVEADIVVAQSQLSSDQAQPAMSYELSDKRRTTTGDSIFDVANPYQGYLIMKRAPGRSYQQISNDRLKLEQRDQPSYHNPTAHKTPNDVLHGLQDTLNLSSAILDKAIELTHGSEHIETMTHNDIKPENFNAERKPDGSWNVNFTDWGTGGFVAKVKNKNSLPLHFAALLDQIAPGKPEVLESNGRFIRRSAEGYEYGVIPHLQIVGGKFHCTLPYISPRISDYHKRKDAVTSIIAREGKPDESLDNWALTAMLFGICNKQAYLTLSQGRANQYYVIPGILEEQNHQLTIVNPSKFNQYFGVGDPVNTHIMYIPGNSREGEPLHLYRRLDSIARNPVTPQAEKERIQSILSQVSDAVASGTGLSKQALKSLVQEAQQLVQTLDPKAKVAAEQQALSAQSKQETLEKLWKDPFATHTDLAPKLKQLATFPNTEEQIKQSQKKLDAIIGKIDSSNYTDLLKDCIAAKQEQILITLLKTIGQKDPTLLKKLIKEQDLLTYALQEGLTSAARKIYDALDPNDKQSQLIQEKHNAPYIKWQGSLLEIAIRRNDEAQLEIILGLMGSQRNAANQSIINKALHAAANLGHSQLFKDIKSHFKITDEEILSISDAKTPTPYHLLVRSPQATPELPWTYWNQHPKEAKEFLLTPNPYMPSLLASEAGNFDGVMQLITMGKDSNLSPEQWIQLFSNKDSNGKNIANHFIEHQARTLLPELIRQIKQIPGLNERQKAEILRQILFNTKSYNPIHNELNRKNVSAEDNIKWMAELQAAILPNLGQKVQSKEMLDVYHD